MYVRMYKGSISTCTTYRPYIYRILSCIYIHIYVHIIEVNNMPTSHNIMQPQYEILYTVNCSHVCIQIMDL